MNFKIHLPQPSKVPTNVVGFHNSSSYPPPQKLSHSLFGIPIFSNRCIKIIRHKRIIKALNGYHFSRAIKMNSLPRLRIAITPSPLHSAYERGKKASGCDACLTACCNSVCTTTRRKKRKGRNKSLFQSLYHPASLQFFRQPALLVEVFVSTVTSKRFLHAVSRKRKALPTGKCINCRTRKCVGGVRVGNLAISAGKYKALKGNRGGASAGG